MSTNKDNSLPGNPNTDVEQMLKETELGDFLSRHRTSAIALVILILVGVFGYGIFNSMNEKKIDKVSSTIFEFESTSLKNLKDKKLKPDAFMTQFNLLQKDFGSYAGAISIVLESSIELKKQGANSQALEVLKTGSKIKGEYSKYIIALHLAAALEDSKDFSGAIVVLEKLTNSKIEASRAKIYLDLGRLNLLSGDKEKAKVNFTYVIENLQDKEMTKLAKIYLSEIV